ncbi:MAG: PEP-CTERM sorting domain-containing protein [Rubrivivax sp.]
MEMIDSMFRMGVRLPNRLRDHPAPGMGRFASRDHLTSRTGRQGGSRETNVHGILKRLIVGAWLAGLAGLAQAALINVDFNAGSGLTQAGAGVFGAAGDTWNGIAGSSGSSLALVASDNTASGVSLTFSASNSFGASCPTNSTYCGTTFESLMREYLVADQGTVGTVTLSGLVAGAKYELALYGAPNVNRRRITQFTANGVTEKSSFNGTDSALTEGVSYVDLIVNADSNGKIAITFEQAGLNPGGISTFLEGNMNGLQIREFTPPIGVPEPSSLALAGGALLLARLRRRKAR